MDIDLEFNIIKDEFGWILINISKRKRLNREMKFNYYKSNIIWKKVHTHVKSYNAAKIIRDNLINRILPKQITERVLKNYLRISDNEEYKIEISKLLKNLKHKARSGVNFAKRQERSEANYK